MMPGRLIQLRPAAQAQASDLTDEGLAAACATGDRVACGIVFDTHADAVNRFLARMRAGDAATIDDLVQATFLTAFRCAGKFRGPRMRSWLYGIAANLLRTHIRTEVRRRRLVARIDDPMTQTVDPVNADVEKLRIAIDALAPLLRAAIVLIDLEGETARDAADALDVSEPKLYRLLAKARGQLKLALGAA